MSGNWARCEMYDIFVEFSEYNRLDCGPIGVNAWALHGKNNN